MAKFIINGPKVLEGKIKLAGNKNSALKLMAAALTANSPSVLTNVPRIRDVEVMGQIMQKLGVKVEGLGTTTLRIDPQGLSTYELDSDLSGRIRASVVLAAPLLVKFGKAIITPPGGDQIGERLLDTHFAMMLKMGIEIKRIDGKYHLTWVKKEKTSLFLEEASVTATEMGLILASSLPLTTEIKDAACEPHVQDLAFFLQKMGVKIEGVGTNHLMIEGKNNLGGHDYQVVPDHIEGGTFAIAAALTKGHVIIEDFIPEHYEMILHYLSGLGVNYEINNKEQQLVVLPSELVAQKRKFQTRPWPGFPTDLMSPFIVLATQAKGTILCHDWMYEWRMFFVDDLISMGANIFIADPHRVIVSGPTKLKADILYSKDIRAGMSVILAALAAEGQSVVDNIEMVERGYEKLAERLKMIGADIKKVVTHEEKS